ncbi:MAG: hypothetical protein HY908_17160 [Myxococcales bacterium]|nr:hypothetical protein [Myxococcales bacterium]
MTSLKSGATYGAGAPASPRRASARRVAIGEDLRWPAPVASPTMSASSALRHADERGAAELLVVTSGRCLGVVRADDLRRALPGAKVVDCVRWPVVSVGPTLGLDEAKAILARTDGARVVSHWHGRFGTIGRADLRCAVAALAMARRHAERGPGRARGPRSGVFTRSGEVADPGDELAALYYADIGGG